MIEFLRQFKNYGIKIARVNPILITKSINLQLFSLILYGVGVHCDLRWFSMLSPFIEKSMVEFEPQFISFYCSDRRVIRRTDCSVNGGWVWAPHECKFSVQCRSLHCRFLWCHYWTDWVYHLSSIWLKLLMCPRHDWTTSPLSTVMAEFFLLCIFMQFCLEQLDRLSTE